MDYILIKGGIRDPLVDTSISCCHYFYIQDFQNPLTLKNKNHVALDTILRILSQYDYLYVFESRNGLNMDYISIKGGIRDPPPR